MPQKTVNYTTNYALARIDLPDQSSHGWQVRLQRRGIKYAKFFSDGTHQSPAHALNNARIWRNKLLTQLNSHDQTRVCQRSSRNNSGVVGVSKVTVSGPNGSNYHFWQATWSPQPRKRQSIKFSIKRHGDHKAFNLAVQARLQAINSP